MGTQHHTLCAEGTPRVETSKNMNVEGEQNASASAPASPTTASTAAVQQAPQITSFFQLARTSPTQATPATSPPPAAADLPAAAAGTNMTAPASPHQQPVADSLSAARTSTAADESTRISQASQPVVVDVVDQGRNTSVGTGGCSEVITPPGL